MLAAFGEMSNAFGVRLRILWRGMYSDNAPFTAGFRAIQLAPDMTAALDEPPASIDSFVDRSLDMLVRMPHGVHHVDTKRFSKIAQLGHTDAMSSCSAATQLHTYIIKALDV